MRYLLIFKLLLKDAARGWMEHRAQRLGASLAFYTTLALAPLSIIAVAVAGYFFGAEAARGEIVDQIDHLVGEQGAIAVEELIHKASEPHQSRVATMISIVLLVIGATGVFAELKDSLDVIWEVKRKPGLGIWAMAKTQLLAFAVVIGTGFLLLISLVLTATLTAFGVSGADLTRALRRQLSAVTVPAALTGAVLGAALSIFLFRGQWAAGVLVGPLLAVAVGSAAARGAARLLAPQVAEATSAENLRTA